MEEEMTRIAMAMLATALTLGAAAVAAEDYGPMTVQKTKLGPVLADAKGMTLYTFDKDMNGKSSCSGQCAEYWPPAKAEMDAKPVGGLTLVKRDDGSMQWADDGKPLYTFAKDKAPGDVTGDGFKGVWHVVKEQ
jgi:predicted lipoprotein with Yx(FWY)xxD motif